MNPILIKDTTYSVPTRRYVYPVGDYLCAVSINDGYKIYKLKQGKPFIGVLFKELEDCLGAINVMYKVYGEFFPIWDQKEWEDANVPALAQWSVKNGINLYKLIQQAEKSGNPLRCSSLHTEMA